jgi:hypothetical protein
MMAPALALALALASGASTPQHRRFLQPNLPKADSVLLATFLASTGTECSGSAVTLSDGTAVTVSRSSAGGCIGSNGATYTSLSSNTPRVNASGIYLEGAGENWVQRSEDLANAGASYWTVGSGTWTSNYAVAPDGATTADRYQYSVAANASTYRILSGVTSNTTHAHSIWIKAGPGGGFASVGVDYLAGAATTCVCGTSDGRACTLYNAGTTCGGSITTDAAWVRVWVAAINSTSVTNVVPFMRPGRVGVTETGDAVFWGSQLEIGNRPTSYIPTNGSNATRNAETVSFTKPAGVVDSKGCVSLTSLVHGVTAGQRLLSMASGGYLSHESTTQGRFNDGTNSTTATAASTIVGRSVTTKARWTGATATTTHDGVSASGTYDGAWTGATVTLGSAGGANFLGGWIRDLRFYSGACL